MLSDGAVNGFVTVLPYSYCWPIVPAGVDQGWSMLQGRKCWMPQQASHELDMT